MALFSRSKKDTAEETVATVKKEKKVSAPSVLPTHIDLSAVLLKPRITEKAVKQNDQNVYTFIVARSATKHTVANAVKSFFKVTPVKVNIVNKTPRQFMSRSKGRKQLEAGMKKAYVYLKKGDRINLV